MKRSRRRNLILLVIALFLVAIQFISIDKTNPKVDPQKSFASLVEIPDDVHILLKEACFDCHSNNTKYPWYTNVQPFAWWIKGHIDNGRQHLNFSEWGNYSAEKADHKLEECAEEIEHKSMPMFSYTLAHGEAKLNDEQREKLVTWFNDLRK